MAKNQASIDDPATWHHFATLDDEFVQMTEKQEVKPRFWQDYKLSSLPATRARYHAVFNADAQKALKKAEHQVCQEEIFIPVSDGANVRALVYRPKEEAPASGLPMVVLVHGGGFIIGNAEMETPTCIRATQSYRCISVSLEYRLSPEVKFPVAYEDCWDALKWLSEHASEMGADLTKGFVFGGTSAGGHISIPLTHRARDEGLTPPLTGVYLNVTPSLVPQSLTDDLIARYKHLYQSRGVLKDGITLSSISMDFYDEAVEPDFSSPLWSPLLWPTGHAGLPPTFFQICGADMLRDDALIYERELRMDHGIKTRVVMYQGLPHVFWYNYPDHSASKKFVEDASNGLGWLLGCVP
ncbi:hypothetical protein PFICI_06535 [Pestalotiopsis fici W106-1]|uniref:Alpha/beta hydrolase fold-3 domain-containing protein n=1 Tax=Pestalotiopsis fici (strain W106-1 / CGMCC3.15140) TaxID=1229662 RepID=W3X5X4_PESFW|nr:uncharacterized protein PFICI_06535 [Pestalotiopsis fici W106-1]ETS81533.1 hypothetical protein PFICI_06535 [Pestalotiopsis fici W106-1]